MLVLLTAVRAPVFWRDMRHQPLFWYSIVLISFFLGHYVILRYQQPLAVPPDLDVLEGFILLCFFSVIAWVLKGKSLSLVRSVLVLAAIGLLASFVLHIDWADIASFFEKRQSFGKAAIAQGLYAGLVLFGFFVFLASLLDLVGNRKWKKIVAIAFWLIGVIVAATAFLATQSRGAWGAFIVAIIVAFFGAMVHCPHALYTNGKRLALPLILGAIFMVGLVVYYQEAIFDRLLQDSSVYEQLITVDRESIPYSSVGRRAHMWIYGIQCWMERPMLGWGVGSAQPLLKQDPNLAIHPHFHNTYIQILVETGLVGLLLFCGLVLLLLFSLCNSFKKGNIPLDIFIFLIGAWVMVLTWSLIDTRLIHYDGRFLWLLLMGVTMVVSQGWLRRKSKSA
ncbi:O-Antigen ligase [Ectothiorhodospira mobilis]|uniref:O-Antigen ligase n=2 Tax=Ectothiorhodospira mobilis TaxID=195064 RepID=A0A1I4R8S2_ECTMO|nr:O-Antigen ligase [Ectothiorhodospira mobilis]